MNKAISIHQGLRRNQGIALIMVLGFLSVLLLLAVAFATLMRLERLTARSYLDVVRARQLVDVALTTALDDLENAVGNDMSPQQPVYVSTGGASMTGDFLGVADGGLKFLPAGLSNVVRGAAASARWTDASVGSAQLAADMPPLRARVAFVAVDCSGYIDANYAGGAALRNSGTNLSEIAVSAAVVPGLDITDGAAFADARTNVWRRFEDLPELWQLVPGSAWVNPYIQNLYTYSYFPTGYIHDGSTIEQPLEIDGAAIDIALVAAKLTDLGFPNPSALADNLADYVDADNEPANIRSFCTESVPMLNELKLEVQAEEGPSGPGFLHLVANFSAELWYPFATDNTNSYSVDIRFLDNPPTWNLRANPLTLTYEAPGEPSPWTSQSPDFGISVLTGQVVSVNEFSVTNLPAMPTEFRMDAQVKEGGTLPVDAIDIDTFPATGLDTSTPFVISREAVDPRVNWDWTTNQWRDVVTDSIGVTNDVTVEMTTGDGTSFMYVRNAPMETVGEFGYLLFDETLPWHTVRFLGPYGAKDFSYLILDAFRLIGHTNEHGFVNLNSTNDLALAAAFTGAPKELYPGEPLPASPNDVVQPIEARRLARQIMTASRPLRGFKNISDLLYVDETQVLGSINETHPQLAESVIRNSVGLLRTRQQLFTIFLAAQVQSENNPNEILAEQRAMAVVWRDPFPDAAGLHPYFVRSFRWLND